MGCDASQAAVGTDLEQHILRPAIGQQRGLGEERIHGDVAGSS